MLSSSLDFCSNLVIRVTAGVTGDWCIRFVRKCLSGSGGEGLWQTYWVGANVASWCLTSPAAIMEPECHRCPWESTGKGPAGVEGCVPVGGAWVPQQQNL